MKEFRYPRQAPSVDGVGQFQAWIGASHIPLKEGGKGPSACIWTIARADDMSAHVARGEERSEDDDSNSTRAQAAAAYRIVEALQPGSGVTIYTRGTYVVGAVNHGADGWSQQGWPNSHPDIWKRYLEARNRPSGDVLANAIHARLGIHRAICDNLTMAALNLLREAEAA